MTPAPKVRENPHPRRITRPLTLLAVSHAGYLGYNAVTKPPGAPLSGSVDDGPPPTPARIAEP